MPLTYVHSDSPLRVLPFSNIIVKCWEIPGAMLHSPTHCLALSSPPGKSILQRALVIMHALPHILHETETQVAMAIDGEQKLPYMVTIDGVLENDRETLLPNRL